jgi:hypothetical protein
MDYLTIKNKNIRANINMKKYNKVSKCISKYQTIIPLNYLTIKNKNPVTKNIRAKYDKI